MGSWLFAAALAVPVAVTEPPEGFAPAVAVLPEAWGPLPPGKHCVVGVGVPAGQDVASHYTADRCTLSWAQVDGLVREARWPVADVDRWMRFKLGEVHQPLTDPALVVPAPAEPPAEAPPEPPAEERTPIPVHWSHLRLLTRVEPAMPPGVADRLGPGRYPCKVRLVIGADGTPTSVSPLDCPDAELLEAARAASLALRARPYKVEGQAVPVSVDLSYNFIVR